jgi:hypothetical protein
VINEPRKRFFTRENNLLQHSSGNGQKPQKSGDVIVVLGWQEYPRFITLDVILKPARNVEDNFFRVDVMFLGYQKSTVLQKSMQTRLYSGSGDIDASEKMCTGKMDSLCT